MIKSYQKASEKFHYFDYNATTPIAYDVWLAMEPFLRSSFANPSTPYGLGRQAASAIRKARKQTAALLGSSQDSEIVFTSGGTESNNTAIRSALSAFPEKKEIITSSVEHSSVLRVCHQLEKEGYRVHRLSVNRDGLIDFEELEKKISDQTALITLMMANNETGVLFPYREIGALAEKRKILFHADAVQGVGKCPFSVLDFHVDYLSLSAHKFYAPKGVGALWVRSGAPFTPLIFGGSQERGRRAGTENVPGIVGLGAAAELAIAQMKTETARIQKLRDHFEASLLNRFPDKIRINGAKDQRLYNTSNLCFVGYEAETILMRLDQKGFCVSTGSACMSGAAEPSHVLKAMGLTPQDAKSSLRFSFGRGTSEEDTASLVQELLEVMDSLSLAGRNK